MLVDYIIVKFPQKRQYLQKNQKKRASMFYVSKIDSFWLAVIMSMLNYCFGVYVYFNSLQAM